MGTLKKKKLLLCKACWEPVWCQVKVTWSLSVTDWVTTAGLLACFHISGLSLFCCLSGLCSLCGYTERCNCRLCQKFFFLQGQGIRWTLTGTIENSAPWEENPNRENVSSFPQRFIGSDAEGEALGGPQLGVRLLCRKEQASSCLLKSYPAGAFCDWPWAGMHMK